MTATEIRSALRIKGSKVFGSVNISEHDSSYIELRKSEVIDVIKDMEKHNVPFTNWTIDEGDIFIN